MAHDVPDYIAPTERRTVGVQSEKFLKDAACGPRLGLPASAEARKRTPIARGVMDYFPAALAAVAEVSLLGNEQHNPGQPLHWTRTKSTDHADCISRHLIERGSTDVDGSRHSAKLAWRALALLQTELEEEAADRETDIEIPESGRPRHGSVTCDGSGSHPHMLVPMSEPVRVGRRTVHWMPTPDEALRRIQAMEREDGK